ncbi:MAG: serine/threonine-protein kinase [Pseudomonadota bacterium]
MAQTELATLPTEPSATLKDAPRLIGRFSIRGEIGRGSNGVVYAAHDPVLGREVAIKAIPLTDDAFFRQQIEANFLNEAKAAGGLNHPHIVTVFDAGRTDELAYIAMERLHGRDLHEFIAAGDKLAPRQAAQLMARVADAAHYAHKRGLVHRDIKPSNIFLLRDTKPKVLDFGVAIAMFTAGDAEHKRQLIGTPNYMSPEQALGRKIDPRSDVFSIGTILYELLAHRRAFEGKTIEETLALVVTCKPAPLAELRPELPRALIDIVERALAKEPDDRYQTAGELRNDLAAFAGQRPAPTTRGRGTTVQTRRGGITGMLDRWEWSRDALAAGTGMLLLGILWFVLSAGDREPPALQAAAPAPVPQPIAAAAPPPQPATGDNAKKEPTGGRAASGDSTRPRVALEARRPRETKADSAPAVPAIGTVTLAIAPWGEVVVNGTTQGVSPPLTKLALAPGLHTIEVRNGVAPPYTTRIEIRAGQTVTLQHRF